MTRPTSVGPENSDLATRLRKLSDSELDFQAQLLTQGERRITIKILHHLNEIERRKLFLDLGYASLFDYCVRKLKYSASAAGRRIQAARCIRRYPEVLQLLHARELCLATISLIEPVLAEENRTSVLERVRGKSYREVDRVASEYRPPIAFRDRIRAVRVATPAPENIHAVLLERELARLAPYPATPGAGSAAGTEQKLLVQFLASQELMGKFEEVRALLSHTHTGASFADVLEVVLGEFLERHSPAARQRRRESRKVSRSGAACTADSEMHSRRREWNAVNGRTRHIAANVRDHVRTRDQRGCAYVARDGTRCGSKRLLQMDHIRPYAAGGGNEPSNLRLLCAAHNRLAAEDPLGAHVMARYWRRRTA